MSNLHNTNVHWIRSFSYEHAGWDAGHGQRSSELENFFPDNNEEVKPKDAHTLADPLMWAPKSIDEISSEAWARPSGVAKG